MTKDAKDSQNANSANYSIISKKISSYVEVWINNHKSDDPLPNLTILTFFYRENIK